MIWSRTSAGPSDSVSSRRRTQVCFGRAASNAFERLQDFGQSDVRAIVQPAQPGRVLDRPDVGYPGGRASVVTRGGRRRGALRKTDRALATFSPGDAAMLNSGSKWPQAA
jgi:hypothetical protein